MPRRSFLNSLWTNILIRTALYYVVLVNLMYWFRDISYDGLDLLSSGNLNEMMVVSKKSLAAAPPYVGPTVLPTIVAMLSAFAFTLPIVWIYTLTRKKKGWQQSVVQTLLVLPVIVAGLVVMVKHSLALAFGLAAIVAAVKFRNSLDDTKDAAYVLITMTIGLASGVNPPVAAVLSIGFNLLITALWYTDFGRAPAALEGKLAQRTLERALEHASRTGTFVARMDDEVFKSLAPDQLEAIADRAWRRRKRNAPELADGESEERRPHAVLLRLRTAAPDELRTAVEPHFGDLFSRWRFGDIVHEPDGMHVVEYAVDFDPTVTPGVVNDKLREAAGARLVRLEMR